MNKNQKNRPTIVCLCGSSRFYQQYQEAEYRETMAGRIYLSIGFYPHAPKDFHGEGVGATSDEKIALDELHKRKIDLADEIFVLNVGGYIGDSTKSEVTYARAVGKPVRWLEPESAWDEDGLYLPVARCVCGQFPDVAVIGIGDEEYDEVECLSCSRAIRQSRRDGLTAVQIWNSTMSSGEFEEDENPLRNPDGGGEEPLAENAMR